MAQPQDTSGRFPHKGERFRKQIIQCFPLGQAEPEFIRLCPQAGVAQRLHIRLQRIDFIYISTTDLQLLRIRVAEDQFHQLLQQKDHSL